MALIKLGALTQDVRGSLNGSTFSRNKGGAYVRSKVSPVQPVSTASAASRQAFKIVSQIWSQQLTDIERAGWIAFASTHPYTNIFGDAITLSGIAFFQAASKTLQNLGFDVIADAPPTWDIDPPGDIAPMVSVDGAGNISVLVNPTVPPASGDITAYLMMTKLVAPGAQVQKNQYRLINIRDGTVRDETYDFGPAYKAYFDPYLPSVGDKLGLLYAYFDTTTGALSVGSTATAIATGLPGPLVLMSAYELYDEGGGDVTPYVYTATPHGLTTGDNIDVITNPTVAYMDGTWNNVTVIGPNILQLATASGTPIGVTANAGTIQHIA